MRIEIINRFKLLPAELLVQMLQDARFNVALEAAHSSGKSSVVDKIRERILSIKYGVFSPNLGLVMNLESRLAWERYLKQFSIITNEETLDFNNTGQLVKTDFYIHAVTYQFLEKLYYAVLFILRNIHYRTYVEPNTSAMKESICSVIERDHRIDLNLKALFYRTLKICLRPPSLYTEVLFYASKQHGYIFPAKEYPILLNTPMQSK